MSYEKTFNFQGFFLHPGNADKSLRTYTEKKNFVFQELYIVTEWFSLERLYRI